MVYDAARDHVLLFGGRTDSLTASGDFGWQLAYDDRRDRIVAYGGRVRELSTTPAAAVAFGAACGSAPQLTVRTRPRLGDADFGFETVGSPNAAVVLALGFSALGVPIGGGCTFETPSRPRRRWRSPTAGASRASGCRSP